MSVPPQKSEEKGKNDVLECTKNKVFLRFSKEILKKQLHFSV